ncbi:PAS domain S-box protein [Rhodopirellula halodulae]|uniref:PAS domain S-box protein n=1 Tax=Rhodopirellula halodulae TaxID=2894198 RepID=UPI001E4403BA|nr:PAS domain S-box protein [Rhodopirellula sp. JC737]MCC9656151.1 PAS domain S-box protein [Rhodopirellula sp. JC737]
MSEPQTRSKSLVVGVGAGAGGLEALQEFLAALGDSPNLSVVFVAQDQSELQSPLALRLAETTSLHLVEVNSRKLLKPNHVYLCPPNSLLSISRTSRLVVKQATNESTATPIDYFFHSIAETQGDMGVGVILSGMGTDGTLGLKSISDAGGMTFAQTSSSARFDSMPRNAATTGVADHVLTPESIAHELKDYVRYLTHQSEEIGDGTILQQIEHAIPEVADVLYAATKHNFRHYKVGTLTRRILRRMQVLQIPSVADYLTRMRDDQEEAQNLFRELLIGVTTFFRDPESFERLAENVLPRIFQGRSPADPVRIWVPGCATGEEAYTLAMLCYEHLDRWQTQRSESNDEIELPTFQIIASDIDERALATARQGVYSLGIAEHVSDERLKRFFVKRGKRYHVKRDLRESILFSLHNLISDAPFSRQDLISCRNLLIYLGPHLQKKLIPLFHYALRPNGFLFLGPSETISSHGELFRSVNSTHRINQRRGSATLESSSDSRGFLSAVEAARPAAILPSGDDSQEIHQVLQRIVLDEFAPKSVVVDLEGQVVCSLADTSPYLSSGEGLFQNNLIKMASRGLRIGLRSAFAEAKVNRRRVVREDLYLATDKGHQRVKLTIQPMMQLGHESELFMVVFQDIGVPVLEKDGSTDTSEGLPPREFSNEEAQHLIEQLEQELATTRDDLERSMQEMEATNEELKSSYDELLAMNRGLQAANEKLENSKEEIRTTSEAVARANSDLENLLRSTRIATIFLDDDLSIRSFTPAATEIYGLIATDIGRPLTQIVPNVHDMPALPAWDELVKSDGMEDTIVANSGKAFIRRVLPYRSHTGNLDGIVLTFTDVTQLSESEELFQTLVRASAQIVWITDAAGTVQSDSPSWREYTGQTYEQWIGDGWLNAIHPDDRELTWKLWTDAVAKGSPLVMEYRLLSRFGDYRWFQVRTAPQRGPDGSVARWVGMNIDVHDQKQSRIELAGREAHLRRVINNQLGLVGVIDRDGLLVEVDDRSLAIAKVQRDDVIGKPFAEAPWWSYDAAVQKQMQDAMQKAFEGEPVRFDVSLFSAGEEGVLIDFMIAPVFDDQGEIEYLIPSGVDIRDRKKAELENREIAVRLEAIFNTAVDGIITIDRRGIINSVNVAATKIFGFELDELIGKNINMLMPEPEHSEHDGYLKTYDRTGQQHIIGHQRQVIGRRKDGSTFDLDLSVSETSLSGEHKYVGIVRDVTDRVKSEQAKKNASRRMQMALRAGGMAAWEWTPKKSYWTKELYELLGLQPEDGANPDLLFSLVHPEDLAGLKEHWEEATQGECDYEFEFRIVKPDGELRWITGMGEIVRGKSGKVTRMYGVNWDSTQEHVQAETLRESERRANEASASKSAFLANMSHEIRTPMTAILGYAELLQEFIHDEEASHHLQTIRRNGDYLLDIINDILDLSKIEAGKLDVEQERFDPCRLIEDVRSIMEVRAKEAGLELTVQYDDQLPQFIQSDSKRLKQVLINLVGNAIKFTPSGSVTLAVRMKSSPDRLCMDVIDTGIGISDDQQSQLFQPFSQGDSSVSRTFGGTGLGLTISQRLAEMLGGEISFRSQLGEGSTFTLCVSTGDLTDVELVDHRDDHHEAVAALAGSSDATISLDCYALIVDDRRDIRFLSKRILTKAGATVDECEDGQQAVDTVIRCMEEDNCPDVIVLDMQMPTLDGYATAKKLRELGFEGPIIALTADAMQGDMNLCLEAGCNDYLSKPIDAAKLIQLVNKLT